MQKYLSSDFTETHPKDAPEEEEQWDFVSLMLITD